MIRLFVPDPLFAEAEVVPSPEQARYLTQVMRRSVGDGVALFNGRDGEWRAALAEVSKRGCRLRVSDQARPHAIGPDLELVIALVKRPRLETIVEKAVELGVRRVRLAITRFTDAGHIKLDRLRAIAIEAAEQCGRLEAPEIAGPEKLERILSDWPPERRLMFCDEAGDAPPALEALADPSARASPWAVLIGPEGGFSPEERQRLRGFDGVVPVVLGPRILRADTAAIAALSLWQAAAGDWASRPTP